MSGLRVLVTGGTRGLGRAIGLKLARGGATVYLTHRWGSVPDEEVIAAFSQAGLQSPRILESDVSDPDDIQALMETVKEECGGLDAIYSNVAFAKVAGAELDSLKRNALDLSLGYSAWPLVSLLQGAVDVTGVYPRYLIGISSDGGDVCHPGYEFAGVSKSVLETFCRYLALRLKPHGVRVNTVRPGFLDTDSAKQTFGPDVLADMQRRFPGMFLEPSAVAKACAALCSGAFDSMTGQTIVIDEGWSLVSPITYVSGVGAPGEYPKSDQ